MQSASFLIPYDSVFKILPTIIKRKGYVVTSADGDEGIIKAHARKNLFTKEKNLEIKIHKMDNHTTGIKLMINDNAIRFEKPTTNDEFEEVRLIDAIYKTF